MSDYQPGDILIARFPYQDDPHQHKIRPVLVLSVESDRKFKVCRITKTNRSGKNKGEWVECASIVGKELGLKCDSFIDLSTMQIIPSSYIIHAKSPIGEYTELTELLQKFNITI